MTPKEKAEDLYKKYLPLVQRWDDFNAISIKKDNAIKSSLIAVDEILSVIDRDTNYQNVYAYFLEVKQEIEKL